MDNRFGFGWVARTALVVVTLFLASYSPHIAHAQTRGDSQAGRPEFRAEMARAQDLLANMAGATAYEKLEQGFKSGKLPELSARKGWWAGRWFSPAPPAFVQASLLVIEERSTAGRGPAFDASPVFFLHVGGSGVSSAYDCVTDDVRATVQKRREDVPHMTFAAAVEGSMTQERLDNIGRPIHRYAVRQLGDYLIVKYDFLFNNKGPARSDYAYYFKRIGPPGR